MDILKMMLIAKSINLSDLYNDAIARITNISEIPIDSNNIDLKELISNTKHLISHLAIIVPGGNKNIPIGIINATINTYGDLNMLIDEKLRNE